MEPKLNKSVPKDQIAILLLATSIGIAAGFLTLRWWSGAPDLTLFVVSYLILGAVLGAFDIGFQRLSNSLFCWKGWAALAAMVAILHFTLPILFLMVPGLAQFFREALPGIVAWLTASIVIGPYHCIRQIRAQTGTVKH
jgi:hypothetical protein